MRACVRMHSKLIIILLPIVGVVASIHDDLRHDAKTHLTGAQCCLARLAQLVCDCQLPGASPEVGGISRIPDIVEGIAFRSLCIRSK